MSVILPIPEDDRYRVYAASDGQTVFSIPFPFQANADVAVLVEATAGSSDWTELTQGDDYTVNGAGGEGGGAATLAAGASDGVRYLVMGQATLDRLTSVVQGGLQKGKRVDDDFDRTRIIQQEIVRELARALKTRIGLAAAFSPELPVPEALKILRVTADAAGLEMVSLGDLAALTFNSPLTHDEETGIVDFEFALLGAADRAALLTQLKEVDGAGSGLDADTLDGEEGAFYAPIDSPALTGAPSAPTAAPGTDTTQVSTTAFVQTAIVQAVSDLLAGAPGALDTLNELAAALGDDANFAATVTASLATKQGQFAFATKAAAEAFDLATAPDAIILMGYAAAGDGGGAVYFKVGGEPTHAGKLQIAEGSWYELAAKVPNAIMFGAAVDGVTDDTAAVQALLDFAGEGRAKITLGRYNVADLTIYGIGDSSDGGLEIEAHGAVFVGSGSIVLNSCKRVCISGLDAPSHYLEFRGCWYSNFYNMRYRRLVVGDAAGTDFSTNYWNNFHGCLSQGITAGTSHSNMNVNTFFGCQMRGDASQGFATTETVGIDLVGDANVQQLLLFGCDVSGFSSIYEIDAGNMSDVEITFEGGYFDTAIPHPTDRANTRIVTRDVHAANDHFYSTLMSAASFAPQYTQTIERVSGWLPFMGVNLVPNGDFSRPLFDYTNMLGFMSGATVTVSTGAGVNNRYMNINQAATTANTTRFQSVPLPLRGRYTAALIMRNADTGDKTVRCNFGGFNFNVALTDDDWSYVTLTVGQELAASEAQDILIYTNDGSAFNVDVCYAAVVFGEQPPLLVPPAAPAEVIGSKTFNPSNLADGAGETTTVTVAGAVLGDFASASFSKSLAGVMLTAWVSAADTVSVLFQNETGGAVDLASGTLRVKVNKVT